MSKREAEKKTDNACSLPQVARLSYRLPLTVTERMDGIPRAFPIQNQGCTSGMSGLARYDARPVNCREIWISLIGSSCVSAFFRESSPEPQRGRLTARFRDTGRGTSAVHLPASLYRIVSDRQASANSSRLDAQELTLMPCSPGRGT